MAFADGLTDWIRGEDGPDVDAASVLVAETVLLLNKYLESKFKK